MALSPQRAPRWSRWGRAALLVLSFPTGPALASDPAAEYAILLAQSVRDDGVDYKGLAEGRAVLDIYVRSLAEADPGPTDPDRIAFWINAHNALVLQQAIDTTPLAAEARTWRVAGRDVTLDGIVEILKESREPLVHFGLHRAARSSPPLAAALYEGKDLSATLEQQARGYLADPGQNLFEYAQLRAKLSMLFLWHRDEFEAGRKGDVPPLQLFLADHLPKKTDPATGQPGDGALARSLRKAPWNISFRPWDASRDDAGGGKRAVGPVWMVLYAVAAAALLFLGFRAFLSRRHA